jgi:hypothetical protein
MQHGIDRSLIQNKLNLSPKKECHCCHTKKSAKYMSTLHKGLCLECATKVDRLTSGTRKRRLAGNAERPAGSREAGKRP